MDSSEIFLPRIDVATQTSQSPASILLISDSPAWLASAREALIAPAFALRVAGDLDLAVRQTRRAAFDLIIADTANPVCECAELCRALRAEVGDDVPILLLGAVDGAEPSLLAGIAAGADDFLADGLPAALVRKKAECLIAQSKERRARHAAEAKYRNLVEALPAIVYVADAEPPYTTRYVSPQAEALGYPREDWCGSRDRWLKLLHPDDFTRVTEAVEQGRAEHHDVELIYRLVARDGSIHWVQDIGRFVFTDEGRALCGQGVMIDITARKQAEAELGRSQERFQAFIKHSSEGIWCCEIEQPIDVSLGEDEQIAALYAHSYLAECNAMMATMYGFARPEEVIGARLGDLVPDNPDNIAYLRALVRSGYRLTNAESHEVDRFGNEVCFANNLIGIVEDGKLLRVWGSQRDITESKRAEAALRESEARLRALVDAIPDTIVRLNRDGVFLDASIASDFTTNVPPAQVAGHSMFDVFPAETARRGVESIARALLTGEMQSLEYVVPVAGETRIREARMVACGEDVVLAIVRDITERRQIEDALRRSEREYRSLFENVTDAILVFEPEDEIILEANSRACEIYGFAKEELIGLSLKTISRDVARGTTRVEEVLRLGHTQGFETVHYRKDGAPLNILGNGAAIEYGGKRAIVSILRDVTEIKRLEQQLIQSEKLAALGHLVSGVAHELNNPLTSVLGYTQLLLREEGLDATVRERLEIISREAERTRRIVQNLLSFARQYKPSRARVDLNDLLERTLELRTYEMRVNGIEVRRELNRLPAILADEHQLQQVFLNLIVNAEQAVGGRTGGVLTVRSITKPLGDQAWVRIEIEDNGPGIAPEHVTKIFDPFFTTKPVGKGTGLGLSISYGIIREHGGVIRAENAAGVGARFVLELPAEPAGD